VFLSNTQTIGFSTLGSVTFSFENIEEDLPVLPSVVAALTDENNARITSSTPAVQTTNPINITYEGQATPFNNTEQRPGVEPIRFIDIQTENLSDSTFVNNTIEFSVAKTNISNADANDVELYQYNGTTGRYESLSTSAPTDSGQDFRYTATYTDVDRDLMIAAGAPEISVQSDSVTAPDTVTAGDTLEITAAVANSGNESGNITIGLSRNGTTVNDTSVNVSAESTRNISLATQLTDIGDQTLTIEGPENSVNRTVTVQSQPANVSLQSGNITAPDTVAEGSRVEVSVAVTNTGGKSGNITLNLTRNEIRVNNASATVSGNDTEVISLSTQLTDLGDQTLTVEGPQNSASKTVTILAQGADVSLQSNSVTAPDTVTAGDTLEITAAVQNIGNESGDITLNLTRNGTRINNTSVTVNADGISNISLSTQLDQTGNQILTVEGSQNRVNKTVTVQPQPANISVRPSSVTAPNTIIEDNRAELNVTVGNTGGESGDITVNLTQSGTRVNNTSVTVSRNDTEIISLSTQLTDPGNQTLIVAGPQNSASRTVRVLAQANISLQSGNVSAPDTATAGDTVDVTATVENTGEVSGDITVNLTQSETRVNNTSVTVSAGGRQTISLSTQLNQTGDQTLTVEGPQNSASRTVNVTPRDTVSDPGGETGTENDGFGVVTALIAFLTIALWIKRTDEKS
jgi:acyl-CoA thioesterase FadM